MRDKTDINKEYYSRLYRTRHPWLFRLRGRISFDQQSKTRLNRLAVVPLIEQGVARGNRMRVLDFGCGWGTFLLSLPRKGIETYGFDIAEESMAALEEVMRSRRRGFHRARWDSEGGLTPREFDLVVCSHVLEHVESDETLLKEF